LGGGFFFSQQRLCPYVHSPHPVPPPTPPADVPPFFDLPPHPAPQCPLLHTPPFFSRQGCGFFALGVFCSHPMNNAGPPPGLFFTVYFRCFPLLTPRVSPPPLKLTKLGFFNFLRTCCPPPFPTVVMAGLGSRICRCSLSLFPPFFLTPNTTGSSQ